MAVGEKVLRDLADEGLNKQVVRVFLEKLAEKETGGLTTKRDRPPVVQSGIPLEEMEREQIKEGLDKWIPGVCRHPISGGTGFGNGHSGGDGRSQGGLESIRLSPGYGKRDPGESIHRPSGEAMREEDKKEGKGELIGVLKEVAQAFDEGVEGFSPTLKTGEVGRVKSVGQGIVWAEGLGQVKSEEMVTVGPDISGMVLDILPDRVGIILFGPSELVGAGDEVLRSGRVLDIPVGNQVIGRVVDPLGRPLDEKGPIAVQERWPVLREAPPILDRAPVEKPLQTGLKVVDALIPIGRGQRELILGDRQTGKTAVAVDTIVNQKDKDVLCIYCAIGQRSSGIAKVVGELEREGAMEFSVVVVVEGDDPPGLQYIAPYAATTLGEYFMGEGRDVLIVYDDLTRHAVAYRQLSLTAPTSSRPGGLSRGYLLCALQASGKIHPPQTGKGRRIPDRLAHCRDGGPEYFRLYPHQSDFHYRRADLSVARPFSEGAPSGGGCGQIRIQGGRKGPDLRVPPGGWRSASILHAISGIRVFCPFWNPPGSKDQKNTGTWSKGAGGFETTAVGSHERRGTDCRSPGRFRRAHGPGARRSDAGRRNGCP